jgi:hypothetical protein
MVHRRCAAKRKTVGKLQNHDGSTDNPGSNDKDHVRETRRVENRMNPLVRILCRGFFETLSNPDFDNGLSSNA